MKANEAPEKIYVNITHPISNEYTEIIAFEDGDGVEYTRTDAFIIKAQKWLTEIHRVCDITDENGYRIELMELQARFENYMKGE